MIGLSSPEGFDGAVLPVPQSSTPITGTVESGLEVPDERAKTGDVENDDKRRDDIEDTVPEDIWERKASDNDDLEETVTLFKPQTKMKARIPDSVTEEDDSMSESNENDSADSFTEPGDKEEFNERRMHGRAMRHAGRNEERTNQRLDELPGNKEIKEAFTQYIRETSSSTGVKGTDVSTVRMYVGNMFTYDDSWLNFEVTIDPSFKACQLFSFAQEDFRLIGDPVPWVKHTGNRPSTQLERLKAHASFRKFLRHSINKNKDKFGTNPLGFMWRGQVEREILDIDEEVNKSGLWKSLHKLDGQKRQEKIHAVNTLNPEEPSRLRECINTFNKSEFRVKRMAEMEKVWAQTTSTAVRPSVKVFNQMGMWVKHELHNLNRDRISSYNFSNSAYTSKRKVFLPEMPQSQSDEEEGNICDRVFVPITPGMNTDAPPKDDPNRKPSAYVLTVMGDSGHIKNMNAHHIIFNARMKELCDKYTDVKEVFFKVSCLSLKKDLTVHIIGKRRSFGPRKTFFCELRG